MMSTEEFIDAFHNPARTEKVVRFAKIDPLYINGLPSLIFDGEQNPTVKKYPHLVGYTPRANDRVMVIHGVIMDKIKTD